jgi:hypothetical protein
VLRIKAIYRELKKWRRVEGLSWIYLMRWLRRRERFLGEKNESIFNYFKYLKKYFLKSSNKIGTQKRQNNETKHIKIFGNLSNPNLYNICNIKILNHSRDGYK